MRPRGRGAGVLAGVLALGAGVLVLVVVASAAGSVRPFDGRKNQWSLEPHPPRKTVDVSPPTGGDIESWWGPFWTALLYLVVALVVLVLIRLIYQVATAPRSKKTRAEKVVPTKAERLAEAVERGLRVVERGTPADAVIACWVGLEDAAAAAGVPRDEAETPAEFTVRVLAVEGVSAPELAVLAGLYREARYSAHPTSEAAREEARAALTRLRADLTRPRADLTRPRAGWTVTPDRLRRPSR
ncbi:DUF4129 domain-containing protein [Kribbella ginsengisoli]|uniref:DUF4129 domain-containing protein n=1 Tax=Kribbella ginsengisoli TaxID=363865 RepID=UPI0031CF1BED